MANIIDLSLLVQEELVFKDIEGDEYHIPGLFTVDIYVKLNNFYKSVGKKLSEEESLMKTQEMVVEILSMDESKTNIDLKFVQSRFKDIRMLRIIIEETMKHLQKLTSDPNSNSLPLVENRAMRREAQK